MLNHDVIGLICAEITDDCIHSAPPDLLSLGLSSRIFLEPALDVMWKKISSMEPLLSVLPETTQWEEGMILKPISPSSWDRLRFYTSRVREFHAPLQHKELNPSVMRLKHVHVLPDDHSAGGFSPGLKSLTLNDYPYSGLSLTLSHLVALEYLSVADLSYLEVDSIQVIALLPELTNLYLTLPAEIVLDYTDVESGFSLLTKLELHGSTSDIRKFLAAAKPQALQELVIERTYQYVTKESLLTDITAITHLLPRSFPFLRHLTFDRLEFLNYNISVPVSDQKTVRIACAWSHLKELYLYHDSPGGVASLESLKATTHATVIQNYPTVLTHPLRWFWCDVETDMTTAHAMALGLHQIFPNLEEADGPGAAWTQNADPMFIEDIVGMVNYASADEGEDIHMNMRDLHGHSDGGLRFGVPDEMHVNSVGEVG
ncbi:hypothetical protein BDP27DRAFT_1421156 [Rhodocollybia butyracea]|uniref:F-box domain-containing protein n=1 Tax=Rhodocollybia butyracea TaxID=206335 RepID=A0A9P5PTL8_9AGAR|nr:hypothetical protein BDP27DRAFT_1421156 [Rhodocollybia butyracea]